MPCYHRSAAIRHGQGGKNLEERCFSGAIRAEQAEELATPYFAGDILERRAVLGSQQLTKRPAHTPTTNREALAEPKDADDDIRRRHLRRVRLGCHRGSSH